MVNGFKYLISIFVTVLFPFRMKGFLLSKLGHRVGGRFSAGPFIMSPATRLNLDDDVSFGLFNAFLCDTIRANSRSRIGSFNILRGWFGIRLYIESYIGSFNTLSSGGRGIKSAKSWFIVGKCSVVTGHHFFDLTKSIAIRNNSVLGGRSSQVWTHGFFHSSAGNRRTRVDGGVIVDNGVYIGSAVVINPGIYIGQDVNVGAGTVVSKSLYDSGMYVSNKMIYIDYNYENLLSKYESDDSHVSGGEVCRKKLYSKRHENV